MRILYVTPYPPLRDGIAAYAVQDVARLRREGHDVQVLSPGPSAAHQHLELRGPRGGLALAKRVRGYDRLVVQFHPDFFFVTPSSDAQRAATAAALGAAFAAARDVEVVVHEVDYRIGAGRSPGALAFRAMWRGVDRVLLHTPREREQFVAAFPVPPGRVLLVEHGAAFVPRTRHDQASARASLDIPAEATVMLAIGFIQPHKGFDRAIRAFAGLAGGAGDGDDGRARLYVVGSLRVEDTAYVAHLEELKALADATPGVEVQVGFVSDELFDRWIVAADVVVLPYRHIWSSGVLERAAIYGRHVVVTAVGGLVDQVSGRDHVTVVADDAALRRAMAEHVHGRVRTDTEHVAEPWPADGDDLRERVQAQVLARAARRRGGPVLAPITAGTSPAGTSPVSAGRRRPGRASSRSATSRSAPSLSAPVRSVPAFSPPAPVSARPGVTGVKRLVRRSTGWLVDPLYWQVNALREATIRALDDSQRALEDSQRALEESQRALGESQRALEESELALEDSQRAPHGDPADG